MSYGVAVVDCCRTIGPTGRQVRKVTAARLRGLQAELGLSDARFAEHVAVWKREWGVRSDRGDLVFERPEVRQSEVMPRSWVQVVVESHRGLPRNIERDDQAVRTSHGKNVVDQSGVKLEDAFNKELIGQLSEEQQTVLGYILQHDGIEHARAAAAQWLASKGALG